MPSPMFDLTPMRKDRVLLATVIGEPFQPVRLYYTIPSKPFVTQILSRLHCMDEDRDGGRWVWLYTAEAEPLTFSRPYAELPAEVHPVVIGAFCFPKKGGMTLELRSFECAIAAAKFFGPLRGASGVNNPRAQLNEEQMREICALLDQGVSPRLIGFSFGVDAKSIRNIDQGKTWRHLPEVAQRANMPRPRRRGGWRRYGRR